MSKKRINSYTLVTIALSLASCSNSSIIAEEQKPLEGFREIKFGMSLNEVLASASPYQFNPYGVQSCIDEMAIKGCLLTKGTDTIFALENGIPYGLHVEFDVQGKATEIILTYEKNDGVLPDQCRSIFERTIDWVSAEIDFNPKKFQFLDGKNAREQRLTKTGLKYQLSPVDDSFIYDSLATDRGVDLSAVGSFIAMDNSKNCRISVRLEKVTAKSSRD